MIFRVPYGTRHWKHQINISNRKVSSPTLTTTDTIFLLSAPFLCIREEWLACRCCYRSSSSLWSPSPRPPAIDYRPISPRRIRLGKLYRTVCVNWKIPFFRSSETLATLSPLFALHRGDFWVDFFCFSFDFFFLAVNWILLFFELKSRYEKKYESAEEIKLRFDIYRENLRMIKSHNKKGLSYTLGVNGILYSSCLYVLVILPLYMLEYLDFLSRCSLNALLIFHD